MALRLQERTPIRSVWLIRFMLLALVLLLGGVASSPRAADAAIAAAPTLTGPTSGSTLANFQPTLTWSNPGGVTQYHLQVIPAKNDGPGIDLHAGSTDNSFVIPAAPRWYGLLPDQTYTWRVRVSDASTFADLSDASWSPWAEATFKTPAVSSTTISAMMPANGETIATRTPVLQWRNTRTEVFYYEVQVSRDPTFNVDPATATAMVYSSLLHAGVTSPLSSYAVPASAPLEDSVTYYWRVRPRVQGDGSPVAWSPSYNFMVDSKSTAAMKVSAVSIGTAAPAQGACVPGGAAASFVASPSFTVIRYAYQYTGAGGVVHSWYINDRPLVSNAITLAATSTCRSGGLAPLLDLPVAPGNLRMEVWAGGERVQSTSFTVTEAAKFALGPVSVGTDVAGICGPTEAATTFRAGTTRLFITWNTVASGSYSATLYKDATKVVSRDYTTPGPIDCNGLAYTQFTSGTWKVEVTSGGQTLQTTTFSVG